MSIKQIIELFFPKFCFGCHKYGTLLCETCINSFNFIKTPLCPYCENPSPKGHTHPCCQQKYGLDGMIVLADYSGINRSLITNLKYKYVTEIVQNYVKIIKNQQPHTPIYFDYITCIPLHPTKEKSRGFNQSKILASELSALYQIPFSDKLLVKKIDTKTQAKMHSLIERKNNVKNAFLAQEKKLITQKNIFLIDDVSTTGSTIFEACKVLKRNGAKKVWSFVLGRKTKPEFL